MGEEWGAVTGWRGSGDADFDEVMKLVPACTSRKINAWNICSRVKHISVTTFT